MKRTAQMRLIEMQRGKRLEVLIREGIEAGKTWEQIAKDLGVSLMTIRGWTEKMGGEVITERTIRFQSEEAMVSVG